MSKLTLFFLLLLWCSPTGAQPIVVKVWPHGAPGALKDSSYHEDTVYTESGAPRVEHVTDPTLSLYLPADSTPLRPAVIICPGGAYGRLAIDHEGIDVARWFNNFGVVGIALKYRLPSGKIMRNTSVGPLQDIQESIRIVRRKAGEWRIDPHRIGVMGFSAGGSVAALASTLYWYHTYDGEDSVSARPDFSLLIYPVISMRENLTHEPSRQNLLGEHPDEHSVLFFSAELNINGNTPPAFLVHSADDQTVPCSNSIEYSLALKANHVPAELHLYETGGHGYGLAQSHHGTESTWPDACRAWMKNHSLLP
ncbi:MAG TPA: alpha/beta hydrolase [Bacteroidota bacterium]|nr:alpha/beta hydrolase [Bacteroidota bacterium]